MDSSASRNIEIKARVGSDEELQRRVEIAIKLTDTDGEIIDQHDIFYNVTNGRLKLRYSKVNMNPMLFRLFYNNIKIINCTARSIKIISVL